MDLGAVSLAISIGVGALTVVQRLFFDDRDRRLRAAEEALAQAHKAVHEHDVQIAMCSTRHEASSDRMDEVAARLSGMETKIAGLSDVLSGIRSDVATILRRSTPPNGVSRP